MKLSDRKIIEFLWKSPVKTFNAILDTLMYLDGQWIWQDLEYELFNEALGDNPDEKISIRIPNIKSIPANSLLNLTRHLCEFQLVRRRVRDVIDPIDQSNELVVFYELTPIGKELLKLFEAIEKAKEKIPT